MNIALQNTTVIAMTRIQEPPIGTTEIPDYKSPPSRILRSLRQGYDNLREKTAKKSQQLMALRGQLRDTQESRDEWKERAKAAEAKVNELENKSANLEASLKKRAGGSN